MKTDVMIDLETLDVTPTATVLTIGAVKFDPFGDDVAEPDCAVLKAIDTGKISAGRHQLYLQLRHESLQKPAYR